MTNVLSIAGPFDDAALEALFVDNIKPDFREVVMAKDSLADLVQAIGDIIDANPVRTGYYVKEQRAFRPVCDLMKRSGWVYCGAGYYSAAFFKNGLAIKVGFKPEDSSLMYAAWCRSNQGRAGVPVIHKLISNGVCFAVLMDRLEAMAGELQEGQSCYDPQLAAEVSCVMEVINHGEDRWGKHMELCRTAIEIREFFMDIANFDIKEANVMLDRERNVIITDPVSFVGDYISSYAKATANG